MRSSVRNFKLSRAFGSKNSDRKETLMLGRCVRRCFDNQTTKRYFIGMTDDLPENHIFFTMKDPCFIPLTADDIGRGNQDPNVKIAQLAAVVQKMGKTKEEPIKTDDLEPEMKFTSKRK